MAEKDDSLHNFIVSLEARAKRILKDADKKRREEIRLEHQRQYVRKPNSSGLTSKKLAQTGSVLMPLVDMSAASSTMKLPGASQSLGKSFDGMMKTQAMHYSVPKLR